VFRSLLKKRFSYEKLGDWVSALEEKRGWFFMSAV
jgi:hypothetical protein